MTAPLFDIKARLSEYVTYAEQGEVVEITKYGKTSTVIISIEEYNRLKENYRPSFVEKLNEWKRRTGGLTEEESADFDRVLARNKEVFAPQGGLF